MRSVDGSAGCRSGEGSPQPEDRPEGSWRHEGLAVACARRFLNRGVPMEELVQEARAAICLAQTRFDPERGVRFSTYAVPVVLGALRECCRRAAPVCLPGGAYRAMAAGQQVGGAEAVRCPACCLTGDPEVLALTGEDSFEERLLLRDAIRRLGCPYGQVIGLRYLCGMSQREAGLWLGAAQWQVCRWEKAGLRMLRAVWDGR